MATGGQFNDQCACRFGCDCLTGRFSVHVSTGRREGCQPEENSSEAVLAGGRDRARGFERRARQENDGELVLIIIYSG